MSTINRFISINHLMGFLLVLLCVFFLVGCKASPASVPGQNKVTEVTLTGSESVSLTEEEVSELAVYLEPKFKGLNIEAVHKLIKEQSVLVAQKHQTWQSDDLFSALKPLVEEGISTWKISVIDATARDHDIILDNKTRKSLRDRFDQSEWYAFMILYEIAFLKTQGVNVVDVVN